MSRAPLCPVTGQAMVREVRPMTLSYKGQSVTFDMPGWYSEKESVHTGDDMEVSDRFLRDLKSRVDGPARPEEKRKSAAAR